MTGSARMRSGSERDERRDVQDELDKELDKYAFTHNNQLFDDSPGKSELNQFENFSGSHSQFGGSASLERGMGGLEKSTDLSFRSKSALPPMSTLSTLSSNTLSPRRAHSEGGRRSSSISRFSPMSTRKVTALGMHESESEYSPSKYYQPARTPHTATRMNPQSQRKVSPRSFKNTATLFNDLGLDDATQKADATNAPRAQSFRLPRDIPDLSTLLNSSRKTVHRAIDSVPVSEDNQKLFVALQDLQSTVDTLERQNQEVQGQMKKSREALRRAEETLKSEQQRANFAEAELKQHLSGAAKSAGNDAQIKALEARNSTLVNALSTAKKELENRSLELELAREEALGVHEERNRAIERLANALERVDRLTAENDSLKAQVLTLQTALEEAKANKANAGGSLDDRITAQVQQRQRSVTPPTAGKVPVKSKKVPLVEDSYSDEGVEVSRSVLNESDIEDLTQEVAETRRRNAEKTRSKSRASSKQVQPKATIESSSRTAARSKSQAMGVKRHSATKTVLERPRSRSSKPRQRQAPIPEVSEDDSFASDEDALEDEDSYASSVDEMTTDEEGDELVSTAEDEPSRILYRRKPQGQGRGRNSGASRVNVQKVISELSKHDIATCTICSRKSAKNAQTHQKTSSIPREPSEDANATLRPSQPPVPALHSVLAALEDEFRHLKLKYHSLTENYNKIDPSLGKRKRKALAADLRLTIEGLEGKADQIYAIFDVLEAAASGMPFVEGERVRKPSPVQQTSRREWITT